MKILDLEVSLDFETSNRCGASGMFQVIEVKTVEGDDLTDKFDVGIHYQDTNEFIEDVCRRDLVPHIPTKDDQRRIGMTTWITFSEAIRQLCVESINLMETVSSGRARRISDR